MSDESRPLRKGDQILLSGGMFSNLIATVARVDWLEDGQRYHLNVHGITCPMSYSDQQIKRFRRHGINSD